MKGGSNEPPTRTEDITDEELIEAVEVACELSTAPVVPSRAVADIEWITYDPDHVTGRLKEIDDGLRKMKSRGWVWWIPGEGQSGGKIDPTAIYWKHVDPEDIPIEVLNQHPEFRVPTRAEQLEQHGESGMLFALAVAVFGFSLLGARDYGVSFVQGSQFEFIGALSLIAGLTFFAFGIVVVGVGRFGQHLNERNIPVSVKSRIQERINVVRERSPLSVNWEKVSFWK